jgi:hypothetical protein
MGSVVSPGYAMGAALCGVSFAEFTDFVNVIIWPLIVLIGMRLLLTDKARQLLTPIMRRVRKLSGGGFAIELSEATARATKSDVERGLQEYAQALDEELERLSHLHSARHALEDVVKAVRDDPNITTPENLRATVHIRDPLFKGSLYQLLDYYPRGKGARRRYSERFGILGLAWRLDEPRDEGEVPTDEKILITDWGMTREQAVSVGHNRHSFLCIPLHSDGSGPVGALYMDAKGEKALAGVRALLEDSRGLTALTTAVGDVDRDIRSLGPGIKLLDND